MSQTGTDDKMYNLVSVLYHALEGASTYQQYAGDAGGDSELVGFFREAQQQQQQLAERAKEVLKQQLG